MSDKQSEFESLSVFEQLKKGLEQGLAHAKGDLTLRTTTLPAPAPPISKSRVAAIRARMGMSQSVFASYLNVPTKTLQSWEQGQRRPKAGEARLLQLFDAAPEQLMNVIERESSRRRRGRSRGGSASRGKQTRQRSRPAAG
jgi:putative transcriptional regulator